MKIKTEKHGRWEVRMTQQRQDARYGAGVYCVRTLIDGRKSGMDKFSTSRDAAEDYFRDEVEIAKRDNGRESHPMTSAFAALDVKYAAIRARN